MINQNCSNINLITIIIKLKQEKIGLKRKDAQNHCMERNQNALSTLSLKKRRVLVFRLIKNVLKHGSNFLKFLL
jgi:hypothetical protein